MYPIPKTPQDAIIVLNLKPNANQSDIKTAYRDLSLLVHPDKNTPDEQTRLKCTARQQQATAAYELLKPKTGGKKRRTMKKSNSKRLNKHFKKSRRHTQT
jgi:DnaJ-class molecular chaperone